MLLSVADASAAQLEVESSVNASMGGVLEVHGRFFFMAAQ
jgi:hypothetical protein